MLRCELLRYEHKLANEFSISRREIIDGGDRPSWDYHDMLRGLR